MSQAGILSVSSSPAVPTEFVTDSGTAIPIGNVLDVFGGNNIQTSGAANVVTISLSGTTNHSVQIGNASGSLTSLAVGNSNTVLLGNTGANPSFGQIPNAALVNSSITINTAGSLTGGGTVSLGGTITLTGTGASGSITMNNGNNITVTGSPVSLGGAVTIAVSGTTNHAIQIGNASASLTSIAIGSTGQVLQANSAADPTWSTATYPSTTTINQLLFSSSNNVVAGLATANNGVLTTGTTGIPVITALAIDGQVIIGSSAGAPAASTLTAGTGISITNGHNSITINATGTGMTWQDQSGTFTAAANNGYFITAASTPTLPAAPTIGDTISFFLDAAATLTITANAGQTIRLGATVSAAAGTCVSGTRGNSITLVYRSTDTQWCATSSVGTWTIT